MVKGRGTKFNACFFCGGPIVITTDEVDMTNIGEEHVVSPESMGQVGAIIPGPTGELIQAHLSHGGVLDLYRKWVLESVQKS